MTPNGIVLSFLCTASELSDALGICMAATAHAAFGHKLEQTEQPCPPSC